MNGERRGELRFRVSGEYGRAEFVCRCLGLIAVLPEGDAARNRLANYVGWALNLSDRDRINWGFTQDDGAGPYVMRGSRSITPDGEEC